MNASFSGRHGAAALAICLAAGAAHAGIGTYTSQSAYLAAAGSTHVDTFDDIGPGGRMAGPLARTAGPFGYVASAGPTSTDFWISGEGGDVWLSTLEQPDSLTFSHFTGNVRGAGGFFFGESPFGTLILADELTITATDTTGATSTHVLSWVEVPTFVGFVSDAPLVSLVVSYTGDWNYLYASANDLHLSAPIPEPQGWHMLVAGCGLLAALPKRRRARPVR